MEKNNYFAGSLTIAMFILLEGFLELMLASGDKYWMENPMREHFQISLLSAIMFGTLNIAYGLLISRLDWHTKSAKPGSNLAITGVIITPLSLFISAFNPFAAYFALPGTLSMLIAWFMMTDQISKSRHPL